MKKQIRLMKEADLDRVIEIEKASFSNPWSRESLGYEITNNLFAYYLVIVVDRLIVGYAGTWLLLDEGHITNVAIDPKYRGQGLARELLEALISIVYQKGAVKMTLEVRESNIPAQELYSSLGFKPHGRRRGYYSDNGEDAIIMWLEIEKHLTITE